MKIDSNENWTKEDTLEPDSQYPIESGEEKRGGEEKRRKLNKKKL